MAFGEFFLAGHGGLSRAGKILAKQVDCFSDTRETVVAVVKKRI